MSRRHLALGCEGQVLAATLDLPEGRPASAGLLIVSGGNEVRSGTGGANARLAARIAEAGHAVMRFDRRGVGDGTGANRGFRHALPDIAAALSALRAEAGVGRIVAFGNCDAASALMLGEGCGADALVLANPWTIEEDGGALPQVQALRAHYRRRIFDPSALRRLLTGGVSWRRLAQSLAGALRPAPGPGELARAMAAGMAAFDGTARILIAGRDRTADAFLAHWDRRDPCLCHCPEAGHGFLEAAASDWLAEQLLEALAE